MSTIRPPRDLSPDLARDEGWEPYLDRGERLLWEGRPVTRIRFQKSDFRKVLFGIVWMAILWKASENLANGNFIGEFVLAVFAAFGLYIMIGHIFWDAFRRRYTRYALTDRRALIATSHWRRTMRSFPVTPSTVVTYRPGPEASVIFARETHDDGEGGTYTVEHGFEFIEDGPTVEGILRTIQANESVR